MNNITEQELTESNKKISEWMKQIEDDFLPTMPLWMRLNYLSNMVSKALQNGNKESDINWDFINKHIKPSDEFSYNLIDSVNSMDELLELRLNIIAASEGVGAWQKHTCITCGEEFFLYHHEVDFFRKKGFNIPKRCKSCREKRKNVK